MKYKRINLALTEEQGEKVNRLSHKEMISMNAWVSKAIDHYIKCLEEPSETNRTDELDESVISKRLEELIYQKMLLLDAFENGNELGGVPMSGKDIAHLIFVREEEMKELAEKKGWKYEPRRHYSR